MSTKCEETKVKSICHQHEPISLLCEEESLLSEERVVGRHWILNGYKRGLVVATGRQTLTPNKVKSHHLLSFDCQHIRSLFYIYKTTPLTFNTRILHVLRLFACGYLLSDLFPSRSNSFLSLHTSKLLEIIIFVSSSIGLSSRPFTTYQARGVFHPMQKTSQITCQIE